MERYMKFFTVAITAFLAIAVAFPAFALDLKQARMAGSVGEKLDGYVAAVKPSAEVDALVVEVNAKRKQEYARISAENGQSVAVVAKVAAEQIINNLDAGVLYQAADGVWKKR